jgi:hypothetical protein
VPYTASQAIIHRRCDRRSQRVTASHQVPGTESQGLVHVPQGPRPWPSFQVVLNQHFRSCPAHSLAPNPATPKFQKHPPPASSVPNISPSMAIWHEGLHRQKGSSWGVERGAGATGAGPGEGRVVLVSKGDAVECPGDCHGIKRMHAAGLVGGTKCSAGAGHDY